MRVETVLTSFVLIASVPLAADGPAPLRRDSDELKQKIAAISARGANPEPGAMRTTVTEREVNAYLAFEAAPTLPQGVVDPSVSMLDGNRVTGRAVVDLDRVRQERNPVSLIDPARYLRGRLMVKATGVVRASNGVARFGSNRPTLPRAHSEVRPPADRRATAIAGKTFGHQPDDRSRRRRHRSRNDTGRAVVVQ